LIESFPVGVVEQPGGGRFDVVDHLVDGHEREAHTVDQLAGELTTIDAIIVHPTNYRLHAVAQTTNTASVLQVQGLNWEGDPAGSQIRHLLFEIHYLY